jgi:hypothetical protein
VTGRKIAGIIILILGTIGLIISVFANVIDVGPIGQNPGFGPRQTTGTILGVIFIAAGGFLTFKK